MRILGIDPGIALTGYGLVEFKGNSSFRVIDFGKIETSSEMRKSLRLFHLHNELTSIITLYQPDVVAIEESFF